MKKVIFTLSIIFLLSCSGESMEVTIDQNLSIDENISTVENKDRRILPTTDVIPEPIPVTKDLIAGQHYTIGTVVVDQDNNNIVVAYTLTDPNWTMIETHLFVGACGDQPMNGQGNPQVGRFPYKAVHENGVSEYTYTIDRIAEGISDTGCVAAHASVISADGTHKSHRLGRWSIYASGGEGDEGNNWATLFGYTLN